MAWSAVNYKDGMVTRPGNRVARTIAAGPRGRPGRAPWLPRPTPAFAVGDQVIVHGYDLGVARHGGFARYARVPAGWVVPLPDGLTPRRAAVLGTAGFTAALSLHRLEHHGLRAGRRTRAGHRGLRRGRRHGGGPVRRPGLRGGGQHRSDRRTRPT